MAIELISHGAKGTGPALMMDALAAAIQAVSNHETTVHYLDGHHGADAILRVGSGSPTTMLVSSCTPTFLTAPVELNLPVSIENLTPIAGLVSDTYVIVARPSDISKSAQDLFSSDTKVGVSPLGGNTHIQSLLLGDIVPGAVDVIEYDSRDEVARDVSLGVLDWTSGVSTDYLDDFAQGRLVPVATFADPVQPRHPLLKDTPSLTEEGIDLRFPLWRGLVAPPGTSETVVAEWGRILGSARQSQPWAQYLVDAGLVDFSADAHEFRALLESENKNYLSWLSRLAEPTE